MSNVKGFTLRFTEYCGEDSDRIQMFLDEATLIMDTPDRWLDFYDVAHDYLAAHLLYTSDGTAAGDGGAQGPVKKQEVDDVVVEMAISNASYAADALYSTAYGKQYLMYRRMCFTGIYGV
jgi:hypothetical protein